MAPKIDPKRFGGFKKLRPAHFYNNDLTTTVHFYQGTVQGCHEASYKKRLTQNEPMSKVSSNCRFSVNFTQPLVSTDHEQLFQMNQKKCIHKVTYLKHSLSDDPKSVLYQRNIFDKITLEKCLENNYSSL